MALVEYFYEDKKKEGRKDRQTYEMKIEGLSGKRKNQWKQARNKWGLWGEIWSKYITYIYKMPWLNPLLRIVKMWQCSKETTEKKICHLYQPCKSAWLCCCLWFWELRSQVLLASSNPNLDRFSTASNSYYHYVLVGVLWDDSTGWP